MEVTKFCSKAKMGVGPELDLERPWKPSLETGCLCFAWAHSHVAADDPVPSLWSPGHAVSTGTYVQACETLTL